MKIPVDATSILGFNRAWTDRVHRCIVLVAGKRAERGSPFDKMRVQGGSIHGDDKGSW